MITCGHRDTKTHDDMWTLRQDDTWSLGH